MAEWSTNQNVPNKIDRELVSGFNVEYGAGGFANIFGHFCCLHLANFIAFIVREHPKSF